MVETKVFEELNIFDIDQEYPSRPPLDLDLNYVPEPEPKGCLPFLFSKLRTKSTETILLVLSFEKKKGKQPLGSGSGT